MPDILLDHVTITVTDLDRSRTFYDAVLAPLGARCDVEYLDPEDEDETGVEAVGYARPDTPVVLWLVLDAEPTAAVHLAFRAADEDVVRAFFAAAQDVGAPVHSPPRPWQVYRPGRFSAMVADPDGNLIEAVAG